MKPARETIDRQVRQALDEDIGRGDVSAALIDTSASARATIVCRQDGTLAGRDWSDSAFTQVDAAITLDWQAADGDAVEAGQTLCRITGPARGILTAERTALNFLQLLSGTATRAAHYVNAVAGTPARILDTRKTLPGLRRAQKYAVTCGGGANHRLGLDDAVLIKENHIRAGGGIEAALERARRLYPDLETEIEVESLDQLEAALAAGAGRVMLDNFSVDELARAVTRAAGRCRLEASGGITLANVAEIAATGVDFISVGELTKRVEPLDLSLQFEH